MLGEEFRKLRKKQNINMTQTCKGITSTSSLQRWETGKGSMPIEKVIDLLARIHIQPEEYLEMTINDDYDLSSYTQAISHAYMINDIKAMKKIVLFFLKLLKKQPNQKLFFKTAIACNYYLDMINVNLFPSKKIKKLEKIILQIENWHQEDLTIFGNTQLLLSSKTVYVTSRSLFSYLIYSKKNGLFFVMAVDTLINAVFVLLKKQDFSEARSLLKELKQLNLSEKYSNEIIRINYAETVFAYLDTGNTVKMDNYLSELEALGFKEKANDFRTGFAQFQSLRKLKK